MDSRLRGNDGKRLPHRQSRLAMTNFMNIRKVEDKDFAEVNGLYKKLYSPSENDVNLVSKDLKTTMLSLLVEEDGRVVGFVSGTVIQYSTKTEAQIWDLIVDEEHRHKGYGSKMVSEFEEEAKKLGATFIVVWVDPDPDEENPTPFYEKSGYKQNKHPVLTKEL